jgi:hypothetical protein
VQHEHRADVACLPALDANNAFRIGHPATNSGLSLTGTVKNSGGWKRGLAIYHQPTAVDPAAKTVFRQVGTIYSVRSALIGSIDAARRAGTKQAASATTINRTQTAAITMGSLGLTLKSN